MANIIINRVVGDYEVMQELADIGLNMSIQSPEKWNYEWCMQHWGTKWDMYKYRLLLECNGRGILYFITANRAPYLDNINISSHVAIDIDEGEEHVLIKRYIINDLLEGN